MSDEDINEHAKQQIKSLMKDRGVGITKLAELSGKSKSQISSLLNTDKGMTLKTLDDIFISLGAVMGFTLVVDEWDDDEDDPAFD